MGKHSFCKLSLKSFVFCMRYLVHISLQFCMCGGHVGVEYMMYISCVRGVGRRYGCRPPQKALGLNGSVHMQAQFSALVSYFRSVTNAKGSR